MKKFQKLNNITGWVVFALSLAVYLMTAEPVASWWDCMEFTATSYKLEVGHPPGAPLFGMVMRLFTMLAAPENVGFASNVMSCVTAAFCILFMFWTITRLARKMDADGWTALGAGVVGALAYAFTDTFWFSAVESEVYATSSMFTALVVWLALRWEEVADEPHATRWLVLIAYVMGLSIGVHILNLLTVPALVFVYYFRKTQKVTWQGVVSATLAAGGILFAIYKLIMPLTVSIGAWTDRQFVNKFDLPVNSGMVAWVVALFALVFLGIFWTHRRGKRILNLILLCTGVILIGYSSYATVVIRSSVNPPMNSNRPDNPYALQELMGRTQYGTSMPIVYGPLFDAEAVDHQYATRWEMGGDGKYHEREYIKDYVYAPRDKVLFPRAWDANYARQYRDWLGLGADEKVTMADNLKYFFGFQWNFMFWRYFMWNFVGRQDDVQGRGDILHGNWLSGVSFVDALYLGPQTDLPAEVERNAGRNKFYFLPFLLGVLGLISQLGRDKKGFTVVALLFGMMGLALVVYFNNVIPGVVRERDYIYAGAFYAFSIWIGLGVTWVKDIIRNYELGIRNFSAIAATVVCLVVPGLLLAQGWDDHDRSGRRIGHDVGYNYMVSTLPNSIIFNFGDNDTFPLWYNQEVEGLRPDVRIMNMSYAGANWYIEQMQFAYNASAPVPLSIPMEVYADNDFTYVEPVLDRAITVREAVDFVADRNPQTQVETESGQRLDYIPSRKLALPVDRDAVLAAGIVRAEDADRMVDTIYFELPTSEPYIRKDQLALLDILASFDWTRPLFTTAPQIFTDLGLGDWMQADGWAFRFVPIKTPYDVLNPGRVDTERMWKLLMEEYKYGGAGDPGVYIDYHSLVNLRFVRSQESFVRLANALLEEGDKARAVQALDRCLAEYPYTKLDYDFVSTYYIMEAYYAAGDLAKGDILMEDYANTLQEYVEYYLQFTGRNGELVTDVWYEKLRDMASLEQLAEFYGRDEQLARISAYLDLFTDPSTGSGSEASEK